MIKRASGKSVCESVRGGEKKKKKKKREKKEKKMRKIVVVVALLRLVHGFSNDLPAIDTAGMSVLRWL